MARVVDFVDVSAAEDRPKESGLKKAVDEVKIKAQRAGYWIRENMGAIVLVAGAGATVVSAASGLMRAVNNSSVGMKRQKDMKELSVYDRSAGHYWALRRKLSNSEWTEVELRRKNGERLGDILEGMKVLK